MRRLVNVGGGRLDKVKIHQSVLIVVNPADTCAHGFEVILFVGLRGVLAKRDSRRLPNVCIPDRDSLALRFGSLPRGTSKLDSGNTHGAERKDCADAAC